VVQQLPVACYADRVKQELAPEVKGGGVMTNETNKVLVKIREEFTKGYWDSDDAQRYSPMLFAFTEPDDRVREALKALSCKKEKDQRYRQGNSAIESGSDFHPAFREIEHLLERYEERYRKRSPEGEAREARDIVMMLMPALMSQKASASVSLDVNAFTQTVYKECENCPIRDICKQAFALCTEYVGKALKSMDFLEAPSEEK
ncbi:MAG: hypothetical protein AABZ02_00060, partial [Bacteroidota bacterium]